MAVKNSPGRKPGGKPVVKKAGGETRTRVAAILDSLSSKIEEKMKREEFDPAVGDFVKILQLKEQFQEHEIPEEIRVIWLETEKSKSGD